MVRHIPSVYQVRLTRRYQKHNRVPPKPPAYPFGWIFHLSTIRESDVLKMIGLDGYMCLRYINMCFRISAFFTFWGLLVLVPIYSTASGNNTYWSRFTIANVPDDYSAKQLWAPVLFSYLFVAFYCQLMHTEYRNFVQKRVKYLVHGDADTPTQTHYTVMLEKIPTSLKSLPLLQAFFERIFPGFNFFNLCYIITKIIIFFFTNYYYYFF
jgi:hypothetical protein